MKFKVPWRRILPHLRELFDAGWNKQEAIDHVADLLDAILVFPVLVPGPAGAALEAVDGTIIKAGLRLAWETWEKK